MQTIGRMLVREGKIAGLFIPINEGLPPGVYNIMEIMGEISVRRVGDSAMDDARLNSLGLDGLYAERSDTCMTPEELKQTQ